MGAADAAVGRRQRAAAMSPSKGAVLAGLIVMLIAAEFLLLWHYVALNRQYVAVAVEAEYLRGAVALCGRPK